MLSQEFLIFIRQINELPFQHPTTFATISSEPEVLEYNHLVHMFKAATGDFAPHGHTLLQHIAMVDTFISGFNDLPMDVFVGIVRHFVVAIVTPAHEHPVVRCGGADTVFPVDPHVG